MENKIPSFRKEQVKGTGVTQEYDGEPKEVNDWSIN